MKNAESNALNNHECSQNWVRNDSRFGAKTWQSSGCHKKEIDASEHQNGSHASVEPDAAVYNGKEQNSNDDTQDCPIRCHQPRLHKI
jgi:hypothetical protein